MLSALAIMLALLALVWASARARIQTPSNSNKIFSTSLIGSGRKTSSQIGNKPQFRFEHLTGLCADPSGSLAFAVDRTSKQIFAIDLRSLQLLPVAADFAFDAAHPAACAVAPSGELLVGESHRLSRLAASSPGQVGQAGSKPAVEVLAGAPLPAGSSAEARDGSGAAAGFAAISSMALHAASPGRLLVVDEPSGLLRLVDVSGPSPAGSLVSTAFSHPGLHAIAFGSSAAVLFGLTRDSGGIVRISMDPWAAAALSGGKCSR
jgi:hypothetical protein